MARLLSTAVLGSIAQILVAAPPGLACPLCHSESGQALREALFNEHFLLNAISILLPFPILFALVALLHFGAPLRKTRSGGAVNGAGHVE